MATTNTDGTIQVTFAVNAWGTVAGGKWPHFQLLLDGTSIGEATVSSATQCWITCLPARVLPSASTTR